MGKWFQSLIGNYFSCNSRNAPRWSLGVDPGFNPSQGIILVAIKKFCSFIRMNSFQSLIGNYFSCNQVVELPQPTQVVSIPHRELFQLQLTQSCCADHLLIVSIPHRELFQLQQEFYQSPDYPELFQSLIGNYFSCNFQCGSLCPRSRCFNPSQGIILVAILENGHPFGKLRFQSLIGNYFSCNINANLLSLFGSGFNPSQGIILVAIRYFL